MSSSQCCGCWWLQTDRQTQLFGRLLASPFGTCKGTLRERKEKERTNENKKNKSHLPTTKIARPYRRVYDDDEDYKPNCKLSGLPAPSRIITYFPVQPTNQTICLYVCLSASGNIFGWNYYYSPWLLLYSFSFSRFLAAECEEEETHTASSTTTTK